MKTQLLVSSLLFIFLLTVGHVARAEKTIPTFESISLYWSPSGGSANKDVLVKFRPTGGAAAWRDGLNMKYNPQNPTYDGGDYRGSIVNLIPGTEYEIKLTLQGTNTSVTYTEVTWTENFPIGQTYTPGNMSGQLTIDASKSGTASGYTLYDGQGATIDVDGNDDASIHIKANYVIIRNFTLKSGKKFGILLDEDVHDVIIEGNNISNWGEVLADGFGTQQGAIHSTVYDTFDCGKDVTSLARIIVQRNKIHHPRSDANSWAEIRHWPNRDSYHPIGPQAVMFLNSAGNHVIRYNEVWSDADHYYNDILGYGCNRDVTGFPGPDSDIYGNYLANAWDDAIETEGGGRNVRVWGNYIENYFVGIAVAETQLGPLYVWNNVSGKSYSPPGSEYWEYGMFLKHEHNENGYKYLFNNTVLQPDGLGAGGVQTVEGNNPNLFNMVTRNNVFHVREQTLRSIGSGSSSNNNDFDYDLMNKPHPDEPNGIDGVPVYAAGTGFNRAAMTGDYSLDSSSPGYDAGVVIPNFRERYIGTAPDMGASEAGGANFEYGVNAYQCSEYVTLTITAINGQVSPATGDFCQGSTVTLIPKGDVGYAFSKWSGDLTGATNPATIRMDTNKAVTAHFIEQTSVMAAWNMDETSGLSLSDAAGNNQNATLNNNSGAFVSGVNGGGIYFDGNRDGTISSANLLKPASVTIASYIKADPSNTSWAWIAAHGDIYGLYIASDGKVEFYYYTGSAWTSVKGNTSVRDHKWHHIAASFNNDTKEIRVYIDGQLDRVKAKTGSITYSKGNNFHIGSTQGRRKFKGTLDELKLFDRELSESEIRNLSNPADVCNKPYSLPSNQWHQISLPCDPGAKDSVTDIFADDIAQAFGNGSASYGSNWIMYRYDSEKGYVKIDETPENRLKQGVGYWIIQKSGNDAALSLPGGSKVTSVNQSDACIASAQGCFDIPLASSSVTAWNMIGYPFESSLNLGDVRVRTINGACNAGCDLDTAQSNNIVHNKLWSFEGEAYATTDTNSTLSPWKSYWAAALGQIEGTNPILLIPRP